MTGWTLTLVIHAASSRVASWSADSAWADLSTQSILLTVSWCFWLLLIGWGTIHPFISSLNRISSSLPQCGEKTKQRATSRAPCFLCPLQSHDLHSQRPHTHMHVHTCRDSDPSWSEPLCMNVVQPPEWPRGLYHHCCHGLYSRIHTVLLCACADNHDGEGQLSNPKIHDEGMLCWQRWSLLSNSLSHPVCELIMITNPNKLHELDPTYCAVNKYVCMYE